MTATIRLPGGEEATVNDDGQWQCQVERFVEPLENMAGVDTVEETPLTDSFINLMAEQAARLTGGEVLKRHRGRKPARGEVN